MSLARIAVVTPRVYLGDPSRNAEETVRCAREANLDGSVVIVFPELNLTGYSIDDLHHQRRMIDATQRGLARIAIETADLDAVIVIGREGRGLSPAVAATLTRRVTIPRHGQAESLNAAVAAGIVCAALRAKT